MITDLTDQELPEAGLLQVMDSETGRRRLIDAGATEVRRLYREQAAARRGELLQSFAAAGVKYLEVTTGEPPLHPLARFFRAANKQGRR